MAIHLQLFYHFVCAKNVANLRCFTGNLGCVGRKLDKLKSPAELYEVNKVTPDIIKEAAKNLRDDKAESVQSK